MKNKKSEKSRLKGITQMAVGFETKHFGLQLSVDGVSMARSAPEYDEPFRIIDDCPVFHVSQNVPSFDVLPFNSSKIRKFGYFYQPSYVNAQYFIGARIYFYCDSRHENSYALWIRVRVDTSAAFGLVKMPLSDAEIIAWTPKVKGDNLHKAVSRMIRAFFIDYAIHNYFGDYADTSARTGIYSDTYMKVINDGSHLGKIAPYGSDFIEYCMGSVLLTEHRSQQSLDSALEDCPDYLKPHFERQASVRTENNEERDYFCDK